MTRRRDLIFGAAAVAAAGAAYGLKPRRNVSLLGSRDLSAMVPGNFGPWQSLDVSDPLALNGDTLEARLYNQLVVRDYRNSSTGAELIMLLAHGARQTDDLQLHRPEVCYPAFGFELLRNEPLAIALPKGQSIPSRKILAQGKSRQEAIIYWSRIGEFLPSDGREQRSDRFKIALQGIVPDGVLCRFSCGVEDPTAAWAMLSDFVRSLLGAMQPEDRDVLIGTARARALASVKFV